MGLFGKSSGGFGIVRDDPYRVRLPESVKEKMRKSDNPIVQLVSTLDDAKKGAKELATDGFYEMVIKKNDDYKTSFEKREEAEKIVSRETSRYNNSKKKLNSQIESLNNHIFSNNKLKEKLCSLITLKTSVTEKVSQYHADSLSAPVISFNDSLSFLSRIFMPHSIDLSDEIRKQAFEEYLENAKDFKVQVSYKIAEMERVSGMIQYLEVILSEEEQLLHALENSLNKRREFNYQRIYDQLHTLLATYIADQTGNPNSNYVKTLEALKQLI